MKINWARLGVFGRAREVRDVGGEEGALSGQRRGPVVQGDRLRRGGDGGPGPERDQVRQLSANELHFVNLLIAGLIERGVLEPARVYDSPFTDMAPEGGRMRCSPADVVSLLNILVEVQGAHDPGRRGGLGVVAGRGRPGKVALPDGPRDPRRRLRQSTSRRPHPAACQGP